MVACGAVRFWLDFPLPFQVFAKLVLRADAAAFLVMDGVGAEIVRGGIVGTGRFLQRAQVGNGVAVQSRHQRMRASRGAFITSIPAASSWQDVQPMPRFRWAMWLK